MFSRFKSTARIIRRRKSSRRFSQSVNVLEQRTLLTSPANLIADIPWDDDPGTAGNQTDYASSADVVAAFNNGRRQEELQLGLAANSLGNLSLPADWDSLSVEDKGLFLINAERTARAESEAGVLGLPLAGIEGNLQQLTEDYANYLVTTNQWTHTPTGGVFDGTDPASRIDEAPVIGGTCHEFLPRVENLAIFFSTDPIALPVERATYAWLYADRSSGWAHREAILLQDEALNGQSGYNNNNGAANSEGFLGFAVASRSDGSYDPFSNGFQYQTFIGMKIFDPVAGTECNYDDGSPESVEVSLSTSAASEADQTIVTITATASGAVSGSQTADITISGDRISTDDYSLSDTTITIADGQTTGSVQLTVQNDSLVEATETLSVALQNFSSGVIGGTNTSADLTITDNDTATFSIDDVSASEDAGTVTFSVSLDQPVDIETQLKVSFADGTATAGDDYNATTQTVTFAANNTDAQSVAVTIVNDSTAESVETFSAALAIRTAVGDRQFDITDTGTATITNDDLPPGLSVAHTNAATIVGEIGNTDSILVSLTTRPTSNVVLDISANNTAEAVVNSNRVTFTPANWDSPQRIVVSGVVDDATDGNQVSTITISVNDELSDDAYVVVADSVVEVTTIDTTNRAYLDIDGDGNASALTDGILALRRAAGFTNNALVGGAVSPSGSRTDAPAIDAWLSEAELVVLDVDADGRFLPLTDGLLIIRYLTGFTGDSLIGGAVSADATRTTSTAIRDFLDNFVPTNSTPAAGAIAPAQGVQNGPQPSRSAFALIVPDQPSRVEHQLADESVSPSAPSTPDTTAKSTIAAGNSIESATIFPVASTADGLFELDSLFADPFRSLEGF